MTRTPTGSGLPARIEEAVGPERAGRAADAGRRAVAQLDRDNHWSQEPAHVFVPPAAPEAR